MKPLKEGETICPECKGKGKHPVVNEKGIIRGYNACEKCLGHGKLDWVERVVGKRIPWEWRTVNITNSLQLQQSLLEQSLKEIRESIIKVYGISPEHIWDKK